MAIPTVRVYEDILCHLYYEKLGGEVTRPDGSIDESLCKVDEVQKQLNILIAVLQSLSAGTGLILTIPYGIIADRVGAKFIFILSITGLVLAGIYNFTILYFWKTFPIHLMWLSPIITILGGGQFVTNMMFYALGSSVSTDANRYLIPTPRKNFLTELRGTVFLYAQCVGLISAMIAPTVASVLMVRTPWIPLVLGLVLLAMGIIPTLFIPETVRSAPAIAEVFTENTSEGSFSLRKRASFFISLKSNIVDVIRRLYESSSVLHSLPILLLLIPFIIEPYILTNYELSNLSLRYISKRFEWKLSETGFLLSVRAFINIILFAVILPAISHLLTDKLHFSAKQKDLYIAQVSAILLVVGALLMSGPTIGSSISGLVVMTLGSGCTSVVRALITTLVDREHVARLYAAVSIVETSSSLLANPILATFYAIGLKWKGVWIGLPFFIVSIICFAGGSGLWSFGLLKTEQEEASFEDTDCTEQ